VLLLTLRTNPHWAGGGGRWGSTVRSGRSCGRSPMWGARSGSRAGPRSPAGRDDDPEGDYHHVIIIIILLLLLLLVLLILIIMIIAALDLVNILLGEAMCGKAA
jgi:hypothetical protein